MAWHHEARARLAASLRGGRDDRELDEELRFHLDMEADRHRARGMGTGEARRVAARDFGSVLRVKDAVRDERGAAPAEALVQDLRFAWRALRRRAGFTGVAVLTLGLGIGATTTLFGVVKAALLMQDVRASVDAMAVSRSLAMASSLSLASR